MRRLFFAASIILSCSLTYGQAIPEMITVPGGCFSMGSNDGQPIEKPVHRVTVSSFKMGKYLITVQEFAAFVKATGYKTDAEKMGTSCIFHNDQNEWYFIKGITWRDDEEGRKREEREWDRPVIHITWDDAITYCKWLSHKTGKTYRLPTEAEWEYAAGNGSRHTLYSWGNDLPDNGKRVGNVRDETQHPVYGSWGDPKFTGYVDGFFFCSPVGYYPPNDFGLYDMTGNVWEWCNDRYDVNYYANSPAKDPRGPKTGENRIFRGGSWHSNVSHSRVTFRYSGPVKNRTPNLGFRVASSLDAPVNKSTKTLAKK